MGYCSDPNPHFDSHWLVLVLQNTSHVSLPHICICLLVFCNPSQYWFYRHISCWPAPHLHLLANSLYPQPVQVLQTHLMSACPTFASPCLFFAPQAGTGCTNTSHVSLPHICIPLLVFCTPSWYWFYKHISCRPAPYLHLLANFLHPRPVWVLQTHPKLA